MKTKFGLFDKKIEMEEIQRPENAAITSFKVIFVGDVCGKTALLKTLTLGKYPTNTWATIGADFFQKSIEVDQSKIKLGIWDIHGGARYGNLCRIYFKEADIAIIGFDLTRKVTFDSAIKWLEEIKLHLNTDCLGRIILVGLKSDAKSDKELDLVALNHFVKENNLCYMTASAKTGKNIEELFQKAVTLKIESTRLKEKTSDDLSRSKLSTL